jgi:hypothetical protein
MKMKLSDFLKITSTVKLNDDPDFDFTQFRTDIFATVEKEPFTLEEDEE